MCPPSSTLCSFLYFSPGLTAACRETAGKSAQAASSVEFGPSKQASLIAITCYSSFTAFCGNHAVRPYLVAASQYGWNSRPHNGGASLFFRTTHSSNLNASNGFIS